MEGTEEIPLIKLLDDAIYCGLDEEKFWNMSIAEINRFIDAWIKRYTRQRKDSINDIYNLADLCAHSLARLYSENAKYEPIDIYFPELFKEEGEQRRERELELSAQRFLQFATSFNKRFED